MASGPVRLITRSRDIKIGRFSQTMTVETEHGNIELDPGMPVPAIEARSGAGNIELTLPEKAAFQLSATASAAMPPTISASRFRKRVSDAAPL